MIKKKEEVVIYEEAVIESEARTAAVQLKSYQPWLG